MSHNNLGKAFDLFFPVSSSNLYVADLRIGDDYLYKSGKSLDGFTYYKNKLDKPVISVTTILARMEDGSYFSPALKKSCRIVDSFDEEDTMYCAILRGLLKDQLPSKKAERMKDKSISPVFGLRLAKKNNVLQLKPKNNE